MQYNQTSEDCFLGIMLFNIKYYDRIYKVYFIQIIIHISQTPSL